MTHEEFLRDFPKLLADYSPALDVLDQIGAIDLVIFIGPSGVGKTTLMSKSGWPYVLSDVTRPQRPEEREGIDYFFRNDYDQIMAELAAGQFVQAAVSPDGELYTTRASSYPPDGPAAIAVVSQAVPIFRQLGFNRTLSVFIVPPSFEEWMRRLGAHNMPAEQLAKRLVEARRSLQFALGDKEVHFILNDTVDRAVSQIKDLLADKVDEKRENIAKQITVENLRKLDDGAQ